MSELPGKAGVDAPVAFLVGLAHLRNGRVHGVAVTFPAGGRRRGLAADPLCAIP